MKFCFLIWFVFSGITQVFSQPEKLIIKAGEPIGVLNKHVYRYPEFSYGKVSFKDGSAGAGKMNLNFFSGDMQFINEQGDTLAMTAESVRLITISEDSFYPYKENIFELIQEYPKGKLVLAQTLKLADEKNTGAYGITSSTHSVDNYNTLRAYAHYTLQLNKDLVFTKEKRYYFSFGSDDFLPVNRKNIFKAFSKQRTQLENYLEENSIDLNHEDYLKKLFAQFLK
jgi:hypothetical protein